ncbi:MAG: ATP synthase F1 subunit gamma [Bacillota bacterium]|nr:ATP synthase F1 subunit gamma [Bacillota bacterium]
MAGAGLITLKRRMKSVLNTRKITKAMGLVATSKLRKARLALTKAQDYNSKYSAIFEEVLNNFDEKSIYTANNGSSKKLYVVFTSESGLCGGYNVSVVSKTVESAGKDKENTRILVVGQKGRGYFNRLRYETIAEYVEVPDIPTVKEADTIARHIFSIFKKGEVGEVYLVYTKFVSSVKQDVEVEKLLPVSRAESKGNNENISFEPSVSEIFNYIVEEYIKQKLYSNLTNAKSSEHASRMNAMDGATKNANELLDKLNLKYNRLRQSSITQEISEIVGGAEAQR